MQGLTISPNGVHIAGNFQSWNPATSQLTDANEDGIYEITLPVPANSTALFKFINGNAWGAGLQETVPPTCGADDGNGGNNRTFSVGNADAVYGPVCFGSCEDCEEEVEPTYVDVTFQVNMNEQTVSEIGVHIVGNFQDWSAGTSEMTDGNLDGIYEITLPVETGSTALFKFINGDNWGAGEEVVPASCGADNGFGGYNRTIEIANESQVYGPVCFNECFNCNVVVEPTFVDITFQVNMTEQTVSENGVHLVGNFQGWNPSTTPLTDENADGIYEVTVSIETGSTALFKFINGNDWGTGEEIVPSECGVDNGFGAYNRTLEIGNENEVFGPICFNSCENCEVIVERTFVDITFQVNMNEQTISENGVHLVGDFQGWNPSATQLTDEDADGIYEVIVSLETGSTALFKFINGNDWGTGEEVVPAECGVDNGFGAYNRTLAVADIAATYGPVCFNECEECDVVVEPTYVDVTFQVNMTEQTVSENGVHLVGDFQDWNPSTTALTDEDADGIYEVIVSLETGSTALFKFINGNDWGAGEEIVPSECGVDNGFGAFNRTLAIAENNATYGPVCFNECEECDVVVEPTYVDVTFQVNMQNEIVSANGVHLVGDFQGWNPALTVMTDSDVDGIYEITLPIEVNTTVSFKYINDNAWGAGEETVPSTCGVDNGFGGYNRTLEIAEADLVYGPYCFGSCAYCFGSCDNCEEIVEPTTVNVTFQVNMQNETVSANGVHIAGSMQGWNPTTSQMTDANADGIYEITLPVDTNSTAQFKFINGNAWGAGEEAVPAGCGVDNGFGGYNRSIEVGTSDTSYGPVCFSSCADCIASEPVLVTLRVDMSQQTIDAAGVYVAGSFNNWDPAATQMSEYAPGLYQAVVVLNAGQSYQYKYLNGSAWTGAELVPIECGVNDGNGGYNRTYAAGSAGETLALVCFSQCSTCTVIAMTQVTFLVNMQDEVVNSSGVHLAGSFNGFSATATPMSLQSGTTYTATVSIPSNTQITYKYLNGNEFTFVETVPFECGVDDGFGGYNRNYNVGGSNVTLPEVCFSSCANCVVSVGQLCCKC